MSLHRRGRDASRHDSRRRRQAAGRSYNAGVIDHGKRYGKRKGMHREGVLIFAAMVLSGLLTVSVAVWMLGSADLMDVSVRIPSETDQQTEAPRPPLPQFREDGSPPR